MNPDDLDREILRLLTEQRLADEASAPAFRQLLARASADVGSRTPAAPAPEGRWAWRAAVAAAAALAVAAGLSFIVPGRELRPASNATTATLATWKAPSDVLLQTPGTELLRRVPVLLPPIPDGDAGTATPRSTLTQVPLSKGVAS